MNAVSKARALRIAAATIAHFEGGASPDGRFRPYWDPNGRVWTQGYGETVGVGPHSRSWSEATARRRLRRALRARFAPAIDRLRLPLTVNQYAALLSFVYNAGVGMLEASHTIGYALRHRRWRAAADALRLYVVSGGHRLPGLVTRREAERHLFLRR